MPSLIALSLNLSLQIFTYKINNKKQLVTKFSQEKFATPEYLSIKITLHPGKPVSKRRRIYKKIPILYKYLTLTVQLKGFITCSGKSNRKWTLKFQVLHFLNGKYYV